jgi:chemotaxis regulatin CheY-phosphate phosphatase CheZ
MRPATNPAFTATAARAADQLDRRLSAESAKTLLNRIERMRRDEEITELRAQLAEVEWRMGVVNDNDRPRYESLAKRIRQYLARVTGEQS